MTMPKSYAVLLVTLLVGSGSALALPIEQTTSTPQATGATMSTRLQRGFAALQGGDLAAASTIFRQELDENPASVPAMFGLAEVATRRGSVAEAETWVNKGIAADGNNAMTLSAAGRFFMRTNRIDRAEELYQKALALNDHFALTHRDLGDLYLHARRNPKKALSYYRRAVDLNGKDPESHFSLGVALAASGGRNGALTELRTAAELAPKNPIPLHTIGRIHAQDKEFAKAVEAFSAALKLDPRFLPSLTDRADAYAELKNDTAALADYTAATQINPNDGTTWLKLGMTQQRTGNVAAARQIFLRVIDLAPKMAPAYNNLAMIELEGNGDLAQARKWADKAVELAPKVPQFLDTKAQVTEKQGALADAIAIYEAATRLPPPQADILHRLALAYEKAGKLAEALATLQQALKVNPKYERAGDVKTSVASLQARLGATRP